MSDRERYRAIWPVLPPQLPLSDLIDEAWPDLQAILIRSRLTIVGRPRWCIRPGADVPGSGGACQVLVADCLVSVMPRNMDALTGDLDRTADDVAAQWVAAS